MVQALEFFAWTVFSILVGVIGFVPDPVDASVRRSCDDPLHLNRIFYYFEYVLISLLGMLIFVAGYDYSSVPVMVLAWSAWGAAALWVAVWAYLLVRYTDLKAQLIVGCTALTVLALSAAGMANVFLPS